MWSVNTVPKARSLSFGLCFFFAVFVIRIASLLISPPSGNEQPGIVPPHELEDDQNGPDARRRGRGRLRRRPPTPQGGPTEATTKMGQFHRPGEKMMGSRSGPNGCRA